MVNRVDDLIKRKDAIKAIEDLQDCYNGFSDTYDKACIIGVLEEVPKAQERKTGKWLEKKVIPMPENGIELQSCRCSECERYDTRPYLYYFSEPHFCSWCGADMGGDADAHDL